MRRADVAGWAALLGGALVWRLLMFSGPNGSDDLAYFDAAQRLAAGGGLTSTIHGLRLGYVAPIAASAALFGLGSFSLLLFNLAASVADVALARLLARRFLDETGAWTAAALVALLPIHVFQATEAHPDMPLAALLSLAALLVLEAVRSGRPALWLAAGAVLGAAQLVKESAFLGAAALAVLAGRPSRKHLPAAAGFAGMLALEMILFAAVTGDPFHRLSLVRHAQPEALRVSDAMGSAPASALDVAPMFLWPGSAAFPAFGLLGLLALAGGIMAVKRPELRTPVAWALALILLPALWPISLVPYRPAMLAVPRIFLPAALPLAILAASALRALPRPAALAAALLTLVVAATSSLVLRTDARRMSEGARIAHAALGESDVVTDPRTAGLLRIYDGGAGRRLVADWNAAPPAGPQATLLNGTWAGLLRQWYRVEPPAGFLPDRPPDLEASVPGRLRLRPLIRGRVERGASDAVRIWRPR